MVSFCQTIFKLSIFTFIVSIAAGELHPFTATSWASLGIGSAAIAQTTEAATATPNQTANSNRDLEAEILAEINRARTDPQGYAAWLQEQKQYYNGILLRLPGEKPIRTNKGLRALEEAIAFLQAQQPLTAIDSSEELAQVAATKIDNLFSTTGKKINNITYGRVTAKAIVMQLVVDDGFPDRRHRQSLFKADVNLTGVSCQPDRRYSTICALAYEGETAEIATKPNSDSTESNIPEVIIESKPDISEAREPNSDNTETDNNIATLPEPPQPSTPAGDSASATDNLESNAETEELASNETESADTNQNTAVPEVDTNSDSEADLEAQLEAEAEELTAIYSNENEETNEDSSNIATARDSNLLEKVKRGILEEGDQIIPNDGSFYDSYPLEGKAGDSFTIILESEEFDTFVAVMDAEGNIIEQNDDISEDESNSRLKITLPSDGIYNVIVNAYDEGGKGNYVLTVRR